MNFLRLITVTLCATVFCACSSAPPRKKVELMTGEQTAKKAGDSAREAEKSESTGILIGSSNESIEKEVEKELPAAEKIFGPQLYGQHCSSCHGAEGKSGGAPFKNVLTLEAINKVVTEGRTSLGMPAWKSQLSTDEITEVSKHVFSLQEIRSATP